MSSASKRTDRRRGPVLPLLALLLAPLGVSPALAQDGAAAPASTPQTPPSELVVGDAASSRAVVAVPALAARNAVTTAAGDTATLGRRIGDVIAADLERSGIYDAKGPGAVRAIGVDEVTAPRYDGWHTLGADNLVQGFVQANGAEITVGCYLYDVAAKRELVRQGFVIAAGDWRRAAHKCSDAIYSRLSGDSPFFDSRVAYIAETGPKGARRKQLAIMDSDGANHRFLTNGQALALTPRFSPDYASLMYLSYLNNRPRIFIYDIASGRQRLVYETDNAMFAPRFSPDGKTILFSMATAGNTDIYRMPAGGGKPQRLTNAPGIDIGGSFSPDGSKIVFESDRSGSQQLYVMNADGSNQQRISFGDGRYATPEWSPRGDLIAFTRLGGTFRVGVMTPDGKNERLVTDSWQDESPSWSPNGRVIQFFRTTQGARGTSSIWQVDVAGGNERKLATPIDASDPAWGPVLK